MLTCNVSLTLTVKGLYHKIILISELTLLFYKRHSRDHRLSQTWRHGLNTIQDIACDAIDPIGRYRTKYYSELRMDVFFYSYINFICPNSNWVTEGGRMFAVTTCQLWNGLSLELKNAVSLESFKNNY